MESIGFWNRPADDYRECIPAHSVRDHHAVRRLYDAQGMLSFMGVVIAAIAAAGARCSLIVSKAAISQSLIRKAYSHCGVIPSS
jgi:hypothetical protein